MTEDDDAPGHDRPAEHRGDTPPKGKPEDVVFPAWFRNFWRTLLGGGRRQ